MPSISLRSIVNTPLRVTVTVRPTSVTPRKFDPAVFLRQALVHSEIVGVPERTLRPTSASFFEILLQGLSGEERVQADIPAQVNGASHQNTMTHVRSSRTIFAQR